MKILFRKYFEFTFWVAAILSFALMPPDSEPHFSFCIFKLAGFNFCPGCGLGHAISYLFHGNLSASLSAHPLGIFAVTVIFYRIYKLSQLHIFTSIKKENAIR